MDLRSKVRHLLVPATGLVLVLLCACQLKPLGGSGPVVPFAVPDESPPRSMNFETDLDDMIHGIPGSGKSPSQIREQWQSKLRLRREKFEVQMKKDREDFSKNENSSRIQFYKRLNERQIDFQKVKKHSADEHSVFFGEQDQMRRSFMSNQTSDRSDFEAQQKQKRQDFEDFVKEKNNTFNDEIKAYEQKLREEKHMLDADKDLSRELEYQKHKQEVAPINEDFAKAKTLPAQSLKTGD